MDQTELFARYGTPAQAIRGLLCIGSLVFLGCSFGCSSGDRLKKQVLSLETQLTALRADEDRAEERLAALELSSSVASHAAAREPAPRVDHPRLKVIHLAPEDEDSSAVEPSEEGQGPAQGAAAGSKDAAGHRPIIRGTGDRVIKIGDPGAPDEATSAATPTDKPVAELDTRARRK